ncbi:hypothetical protein HN51_016861 [Arachis hypogaea]|uniref:Phosphoglycerate mutase-like protein n=1 Tax=Arachis hypogaea TaxID=3818 RepID=A0A445CUX8_ARAHY|nr:putative phosphoglycerate mutase family protein [Arachis hypogaea]RYR54719.1 hypothetical protein Ahy_A06g030013 isoform D [Arachis hypogaea]
MKFHCNFHSNSCHMKTQSFVRISYFLVSVSSFYDFCPYLSVSLASTYTHTMESTQNQDHTSVSYQNVVVMRHADRLDNFDPCWASTAARPWDPPLFEAGRLRAFQTGRSLRDTLGYPIHRVFVSPFLRCVQTASEVVSALSTVDAAEVKVSVEYGLCEMMNKMAFRNGVAPKDGNWGFNITQLEAMFPTGTLSSNAERVDKELPQWEESFEETRDRYERIFKELADKYPAENMLFVTHGEGIKVAVSSFRKDAKVYKVGYCGYVQLRRPILKKDQSFVTGEFDVLTDSDQTGVSYNTTKPSHQ